MRSRLRLARVLVALAVTLAVCGVACLLVQRASAQPLAAPFRIQGFAPDAQVTGAVGVGLGEDLSNPFLARGRLGALYAYEPFVVHLGATLEAGGLANLGVGGELELGHFGGFFLQLSAAHVKGSDLMLHAAAGYTVLGIEWQHRYDEARPSDVLLLQVRLPLGMWWLMRKQQAPPPAAPPRLPPSAADTTATPAEPTPAPPTATATATPEVTAATRERASTTATSGHTAREAGDHRLAAELFARAHAIEPDPLYLLSLAQAQLAQGQLVFASDSLRNFLSSAREPAALARKPEASAQLAQLLERVAQLRLSVQGTRPGDVLDLDGQQVPAALLGYDVPIDPGPHRVIVRRGDRVLFDRVVHADERSIVRISIDLDAPSVTPEAASGSEASDE